MKKAVLLLCTFILWSMPHYIASASIKSWLKERKVTKDIKTKEARLKAALQSVERYKRHDWVNFIYEKISSIIDNVNGIAADPIATAKFKMEDYALLKDRLSQIKGKTCRMGFRIRSIIIGDEDVNELIDNLIDATGLYIQALSTQTQKESIGTK